MKLLFEYLKRHKAMLGLALFLATVNQVFSLLDPQIFRIIIDQYASRVLEMPRAEFIGGVLWLVLASMGVAFVSRVAKNFQDYYVNVITQKVGAQLYNDAVAHAFRLPYRVFEDQRSGQLLQNLEKARADAHRLILSFINIVFLSLVGIVFVLAYAFVVHWSTGLAYVLVIPTLGGTMFAISRRIKKIQQKIVKITADLAGSTTETLRNVELVKSLGLDEQETKRLNGVNEEILALELEKVRKTRKLFFLQGTMINAMRSAILFLMLWLVASGNITLGEFFTLLFYSFAIFAPLSEIGLVATQYQEAKASMEALEAIMKEEPEREPDHPVDPGPLRSLVLSDLGFRYQSRSDNAVDDISIDLRAGRSVAIVGPSGSGKSTLIKLLVGLYKPTAGTMEINGRSIDSIDYRTVRNRIGYVSQETQLFAGTIRENLLFVKPSATDEQCLAALAHAEALPIIERAGEGLDAKIGEGGIKVSGGERQRLAIARALLRQPDILIFDEATSSLDSATERAITQTIRRIEKENRNLMMVMVAHRLSTIAHADEIVVLEKGKIIERGSHDALLANKNLYFALWRQQSAVSE